jgi:hypothetical protein
MGSLGTGVDVSDITYRNIYTWSSNQMYMIKSNGGSGNVENVLLENFIGKNSFTNYLSRSTNRYRSRQRLLPRHRRRLEQHEQSLRRRRPIDQRHSQELEGNRS